MSKIDRQLNEASGESVVAIQWPRSGLVNVDRLREQLIDEIDCHQYRVPLDLRAVHGAPDALIELLNEAQRYARSQGKLISISAALPPMQQALGPHRPQPAAAPQDREEATGASEIAGELLDSRHAEAPNYDVSKAEKVKRAKPNRLKRRRQRRNWIAIGSVILAATFAIGVLEWFYLASQDSPVIQPDKTFETRP